MDFVKKAASAAGIAVVTTFAVFAATPHFPEAARLLSLVAVNLWTWISMVSLIVGLKVIRIRWGGGFGGTDWGFQIASWIVGASILGIAVYGIVRLAPIF